MLIALVCESQDVDVQASVPRLVEALNLQLIEDYAPAWERLAPEVRAFASEADARGSGAHALVVILDSPTQAGALGYHTYTPQGGIYSPIFWEPIRDDGGGALTVGGASESLSSVTSHETLELSGDAYGNRLADRPNGTEEWEELCDRVQGTTYEKTLADGTKVAVSDFLLPRAFSAGGPGPYRFTAAAGGADLPTSDALDPMGYVDERTGGPGGPETTIFGSTIRAHSAATSSTLRRVLTPHPGSRRAWRGAGKTRRPHGDPWAHAPIGHGA